MQPKVKLQLRAKDFRQHPAVDACVPHWMMGTVYGRQLAKVKVRQMHPDLGVHLIRWQPEYERLLESAFDVLHLREWPAPSTFSERLRALHNVLRITLEIEHGLSMGNR